MNALVPLARVKMTEAQRRAVESYRLLERKLGRVPSQTEAVSRLVIDLGGRRHGVSVVLASLRRMGVIRPDGTLAETVAGVDVLSAATPVVPAEVPVAVLDHAAPGWCHPQAGEPVVAGNPISRALMVLLPRGEPGRRGYVLDGRPCGAADLVRAANSVLAERSLPLIAYPGVAVPPQGAAHGGGPARR
ncbi:hypothetical protein H261_03323 [Paramagnetospirillum caucaseum]|uniref:Uncharacterized protein n=1 Tax=Paramagnetospirillum caucaseum TaxID=1244869 RepID=M2ZVI1_9PROT|nr:hypothetical protein [Paramagnetospirillum caucaseum]EME71407.1 hypothetical protein H261_03323 [Paramagnetospirillum caucaseum]